ncbi:hypothetical protein B0T10DRAFT_591744 [Thelonectria olida]|uniref:Uncharacterized protein n=1 Tax=Thelonectria olida TaxID=1576542 RepID=A0A9P8W9E2_9HYPO|nr:hypothetical protein B0T10DRAFT_591744 [Thelonectria olida]
MATQDALRRFIGAMEVVYGPFQDLTEEEAGLWSPPENPGAGGHRGRYLWTDAFGVVNFVTLFKETSSPKYLVLAKRLVQTVHDVLGRTRDGLARLPGATDDEPLSGGLRIGKLSASGSDGDGQYHHYLTLWMFALNRVSLATGDSKYNDLAIQLAKAIHPRFIIHRPSGKLRMVWKISMDMKHILVASEGHLDAATGHVICRLLQRTAVGQEALLKQEIDDYLQIMSCDGKLSPSGDTLDLGMGLWMCHFFKDEPWAAELGDKGLRLAKRTLSEDSSTMLRDASQRLMFREVGACMGVSCYGGDDDLESKVAALMEFWEKHMEQQEDEDLRPISLVMYSAALIVGAFHDGYLGDL